jgi:hypothetical protein
VQFQSTQTKQFFIPKFEKKTWDVTHRGVAADHP